jgi:outer membrane protein
VSKQLLRWSAALAFGAIAFGQSTPSKVGVIHIQSALVGTKDGQKAAQELEAKRAPKAKEFEKRQAEIRQLQDSMNRGGNAMAEAAKQTLARDIDQKTKAFNRDLEDWQAETEQEQNKILQNLGQKMMVVIDKYAKDNAFALIVDVSNPQTPVLFASSAIDITKEIIDLYDKNALSPTSATPPPAKPVESKPAPGPAGATKK